MKKLAWALVWLAVLAAAPAAADDWKYDVVLYGWLAGLEGDIGIADVGTVPVNASFSDLANYVDFAMAGHFEAKNANTIFLTDISFVGLGAERDAQVANQTVTVDMDSDQWILEFTGGYSVNKALDLFLAGRYYIFDMGATFASVAGSSAGDASQDWGDIYVGARYSKLLKEKWILSLRGDIGAGGSDFAWFGNALVGYRFNDKFSTGVAWRVLSLDREGDADNPFIYDVTQSGLGIGVGYSF